MPNTYELIAQSNITTTTASVTFSGIPNTYNDLCIHWSGRTDAAGVDRSIALRANNDSTSGAYGFTRMYSDGSATSASGSTRAEVLVNGFTGTTATANIFGAGMIYLSDYTNTRAKQFSVWGATENNANESIIAYISSVATTITSAVTTLTLIGNQFAGNGYIANSNFYLFGIKNT